MENHMGHRVTNLKEMSDEAGSFLFQYEETLKKDVLPQATEHIRELQRKKRSSQRRRKKVKEQIRRKVSDLQAKLAKLGEDSEKMVDELCDEEERVLDKLIAESEENSQRIRKLIENCRKSDERENLTERALLLAECPKEISMLLPKVDLPPSFTFCLSNFLPSSPDDVIGKFIKEVKGKSLCNPEKSNLKFPQAVVKSILGISVNSGPSSSHDFHPSMIHIQKEGEFITCFTPSCTAMKETDEMWVNGDGEALVLYDEAGNLKDTKQLDFDISDIALSETNDVIAADFTNNRIVSISAAVDVTFICSTAPLTPTSICTNDRHQLVVGLRESMTSSEHTIKRLTVIAKNGQRVLQEMEEDEDGNALFHGFIYKVRHNNKGDYVVLDGYCTIVCITKEGPLRWKHEELGIWGIECDRYCNVIYCADRGVAMLNSDGRLIRQLLTSDKDGVVSPRSIALDRQDRLWIGLYKNRVQIWSYLK